MARRTKPKVNLAQEVPPRSGDLEALFSTAGDAEQASGLQLLAIRLDTITPDPDQPRRVFPVESLRDLSKSIKQDGVIQPIEVTEIGPRKYMIVHGERRWRAAQLAGLDTIPAVVRRRDYDTVTRFVRQMVENIQREDLNDVDRAAGLLRLRDLLQEELLAQEPDLMDTQQPWASKVTWAKVGKRLGYSRQRIHQLIQLLKLPEEIKDAVREGTLSERDTRIYQGLRTPHQRELHQVRIEEELDNKVVREIVKRLKETPDKSVPQVLQEISEPPPSFAIETGPKAAAPPPSYSTPSPPLPASRRHTPNIYRLYWAHNHITLFNSQGLNDEEKATVLKVLDLIEQDISRLKQETEG